MASVSSMASRTRCLLSGFLVLTLATRIMAADIAYCSTQNTGSYFAMVYDQYQSNGACHDTCKGSYSVAVISGYNCWCTNYAPATTVSTYDCSSPCPGFGSEWCGNPSSGLFAYFLIDGARPLGTAGAASSTVAGSSSSLVSTTLKSTGSSASIFSTPNGGSSSLTVTATPQSSRTFSSVVKPSTTLTGPSTEQSVTSLSTSSSSPPASSSSTSTRTTAPSQVTATQSLTEVYTSVTTVTGQVRTVLITPTPSTDSTLGSNSSLGSSNGGVSPGKVVGIVVGVALGLGIVIGLVVWYWLRRRHQRNMAAIADDPSIASNTNNGVPSRQVSQMSSAGLLSKGPRINTTGIPSGNGPRSAQSSQFNRQSLGTDQRLNPYAIYAQEESRHSNVSLQDNHDYSRQLRVANPDP